LSSHVQPSPRLPGPYAAVVFDMDGLLVHTERQWLQAKLVLFENHGCELTRADRTAVFGVADLETVTYFARRFGLPDARVADLQDEYLDIIGRLIDDGIELTDGATELVTYLQAHVPLALATNTRRPLVDRILRQTPFASAFGAIATGEEVPPKPAPDVYRLACQRLGVEPPHAVAIEDSPTGVRAAQAAGLTCIGVPSDSEHPLPEADHLVGSLRELLQDEA
jgi:beta-phosphoglucomutase-like phosphatase (HAD superfamily)